MILEGLVTSLSGDESMHLAPMGPSVDSDFREFLLRPFPTSQTYKNLQRHPEGVLHVTDDVLLLAQASIGRIVESPPHRPADVVRGFVLTNACRAYEFRVNSIDDSEQRVRLKCVVVQEHRLRDFFGFNRAKHAVIEAAILATRAHLIPIAEIQAEYAKLETLVRKTGGDQERAAFDLLREYIVEFGREKP
jgi:hypothetical protein